jgi:cyanophycinase
LARASVKLHILVYWLDIDMEYLRNKMVTVLLILFSLGLSCVVLPTAKAEPGTLILIGDVLRHNQNAIWERIYQLAGGDMADFVVLATANPRPKLYGGFAVRALQRYGVFVDLMPIAIDADEFGIDAQQAVNDPSIVDRVREANAVFFVGGAPQRLASVMSNADRSVTPLAEAIHESYATGGTIIGGVPADLGVSTDIGGLDALRQGYYAENDIYRGLGLLDDDWYVDQHFFSAGQFAHSLIAMSHLNKTYALGIGANTAAIINDKQLEVLGDGGVMLVDLSQATASTDDSGFSLKGARLSYLDQGDRLDMTSLEVTAHSYKLDEFEVMPAVSADHARGKKFVINDVFSRGSLLRLIITALEGEWERVEGIAFNAESGQQGDGFVFRFYTKADSIGWLSTMLGGERWTVLNIYLDILPPDDKQVSRND